MLRCLSSGEENVNAFTTLPAPGRAGHLRGHLGARLCATVLALCARVMDHRLFLEGAVTAAAFITYVRLIEKRDPCELSAWRWRFLLLGTLIGSGFFALLIGMLAVSGHYRFESFELPLLFFTAIVFALGTAIWEEVTFRGLFFRSIERTGGTWVGVAVSALVFGAVHGLNPNASPLAAAAIIVESRLMLAFAYVVMRTLWFPIGIHLGWNFTEDYLFGVRMSGHAARPAVLPVR
jgi:uncharacterized protein